MRIFKVSFLLVIALFATQFLYAQRKNPPKPVVTPAPKIKPVKLQTFLDTYKDSVNISAKEAIRLIGLPLKIYDDKKNQYSISSYQFLYKKRSVKEEEADLSDPNARPIPTTTISSDRFKITPLPELWVNLVREQVKAGEEFYFFDVIAKDAQGRVMYASNLKIIISN